MAKRKRQTVEEFLAELQGDPAYVKRVRERDERIAREEDELSRAEAPLVKALDAAGIHVTSAWDLVNTRRPHPKAVPILLSHLKRPYPERVREGIARALAVPQAKVGWKQLVDSYLREDESPTPGLEVNEVKWALHLAIAAAADASVLDELAALAIDRRLGYHRSSFVDALERIGSPRARATLEELRGDPFLADAFAQLDKRKKNRARKR